MGNFRSDTELQARGVQKLTHIYVCLLADVITVAKIYSGTVPHTGHSVEKQIKVLRWTNLTN